MKTKIIIVFFLALILFATGSVQANEEIIQQDIDANADIEINQNEIQEILKTKEIDYSGEINVIENITSFDEDGLTITLDRNNGNVIFDFDNCTLLKTDNIAVVLRDRSNYNITYEKNIELINGSGRLIFENMDLSYGTELIWSFKYNSLSVQFSRPLSIMDNSTTIISDDIIMYYKNGTQLIIKIKDSEGNPIISYSSIPNDPSYKGMQMYNYGYNFVTITINGVSYNKSFDENGTVKMDINLNPGDYEIFITYSGLRTFAIGGPSSEFLHPPSNLTTNLKVLPTVIGEDLTKYYKNDSQYLVKILDGQGNPLSNANVKMNINGVFYNKITDKDGYATLAINLNPGKYIITVYHPITGLAMNNNIEVLDTLIGKDVNMSDRIIDSYEVKVLDGQGNPLENETVEININGRIFNISSDVNGIATLDIDFYSFYLDSYNYSNFVKLIKEIYDVTATWNGYSVSNKISIEYYWRTYLFTMDISNIGNSS